VIVTTGLICLQLDFTLVQHMPAIGIMQEHMHHEISLCWQYISVNLQVEWLCVLSIT